MIVLRGDLLQVMLKGKLETRKRPRYLGGVGGVSVEKLYCKRQYGEDEQWTQSFHNVEISGASHDACGIFAESD